MKTALGIIIALASSCGSRHVPGCGEVGRHIADVMARARVGDVASFRTDTERNMQAERFVTLCSVSSDTTRACLMKSTDAAMLRACGVVLEPLGDAGPSLDDTPDAQIPAGGHGIVVDWIVRGSSTGSGVSALAAGGDGVVVAGTAAREFDLGPSHIAVSPLEGTFVAKLASDGSITWARALPGDLAGLAVDDEGSAWVAGRVASLPKGAQPIGAIHAGASHLSVVVGLSPDGEIVHQYGLSDISLGAVTMVDHDLAIAGSAFGDVDLGRLRCGASGLFAARLHDGHPVWGYCSADVEASVASIEVAANDSAVLCGSFKSALTMGATVHASGDSDDLFVGALDAKTGQPRELHSYGGPWPEECGEIRSVGKDLVVGASGHGDLVGRDVDQDPRSAPVVMRLDATGTREWGWTTPVVGRACGVAQLRDGRLVVAIDSADGSFLVQLSDDGKELGRVDLSRIAQHLRLSGIIVAGNDAILLGGMSFDDPNAVAFRALLARIRLGPSR